MSNREKERTHKNQKKQKPLRRKEGSPPLFSRARVFRLSLFSVYNKNLLINIFYFKTTLWWTFFPFLITR